MMEVIAFEDEKKAAASKLDEVLCSLPSNVGSVYLVADSPDGKRIGSISGDKKVYVHDSSTGARIKRLPGHTRSCTSVAFNNSSDILATASLIGEIIFWPLDKEGDILNVHEVVGSIDFCSDMNLVAAAVGPLVIMWDINSGAKYGFCPTKNKEETVLFIKFTPKGLVMGIENRYYTRKERLPETSKTISDEFSDLGVFQSSCVESQTPTYYIPNFNPSLPDEEDDEIQVLKIIPKKRPNDLINSEKENTSEQIFDHHELNHQIPEVNSTRFEQCEMLYLNSLCQMHDQSWGYVPVEAIPDTVQVQPIEAMPDTVQVQPVEAIPDTVQVQPIEAMPDTVQVQPVEAMPDTVHLWPNPVQYEISLHPNQIHQVPPCSAPGPVTISDTARKPPTLVTITDEMADFMAIIVSRREFQDPESLVPSSCSMTDDTLEICKDDDRIESWPFEIKDGLPIIQTENACVVVRNCIIKGDATVDVSRTGDKLVAFIPDKTQEGGVIVGIFSLLRNNLGQLLGSYGPVPTPVSISFSPQSKFLLMGLESTRSSQWASIVSPDILIQMLSIEENAENNLQIQLYRSFNRRNEIRHPKNFRIYQVKWLLNKESLFAIAMKGALILVKPRDEVEEDLSITTALSMGN